MTAPLHSLYFSLLTECLSALMGTVKTDWIKQNSDPDAVSDTDRDSPPPVKKPRLADSCPYEDSDLDLVLLLDDGTRVQANREAVAGAEGAAGSGSEYFRALLRGGFGEARGGAEEAICIKDVNAGVLLPVLHYLHGCRLGGAPRCQTLDSLVRNGPVACQNGTETRAAEDFQKTPLGEAMIGACRFLVNELQRELEDAVVSFLTDRREPASAGDGAKRSESKADQERREAAEESLGTLTELSGRARKLKTLLQQTESETASLAGTIQEVITGLSSGLDENTIRKVISDSKPVLASVNKSLDPGENPPGPKNLMRFSSSSETAAEREVLAALLPQLYWFSQRYSYQSLGRACLSLLLGRQDRPRSFSSSVAADCLRTLAREADCRETLKQDLLSLVSAALS